MGTRVYADRELPSATERVARFRLYSQEMSLGELEDAELLVVDRENHEVREGPQFEEGWDELVE